MNLIAILVAGLCLGACNVDTRALDTRALSMTQARTYTGSGEVKKCRENRWMECDGTRTPAEANGGN